jgi:flagellar protein FlaG
MKVDAQSQSAIQGQMLGPGSLGRAPGVAPAGSPELARVNTPQVEFSPEDLRRIMEGAAALITDFLAASGRRVSAGVDQVSGAIVVRVMNPESGELIRQIPSDEILGVLRYFNQTAKGVLVSQTA